MRINRSIKFTFTTLALAATILSCARAPEEAVPDFKPQISIDLTRADGEEGDIIYKVYVFKRASGTVGEYLYCELLETDDEETTLSFSLAELYANDFRFLFLGIPDAATEQLKVVNAAAETALINNDPWSAVRIKRNVELLGIDNYCVVKDISGQEIVDAGKVSATLDRIVGQVVIDIFKADGSVSKPEAINPQFTESVADWIHTISIKYTKATNRLTFDSNNKPVPDPAAGVYTFTETPISLELTPEASKLITFAAKFPQPDKRIIAHPDHGGAIRIKGAYLLPAVSDAGGSGARVEIKVEYYDPWHKPDNNCGLGVEHHTEDCFYHKEFSLYTPSPAKTAGLTVVGDHMTIVKAGLPCDRIIDLPRNGGLILEVDWDN